MLPQRAGSRVACAALTGPQSPLSPPTRCYSDVLVKSAAARAIRVVLAATSSDVDLRFGAKVHFRLTPGLSLCWQRAMRRRCRVRNRLQALQPLLGACDRRWVRRPHTLRHPENARVHLLIIGLLQLLWLTKFSLPRCRGWGGSTFSGVVKSQVQ